MAFDGPALAAIAIGSIFAYGGLKGKSPIAVIANTISGAGPSNVPNTHPLDTTPAPGESPGGTTGGNSPGGPGTGPGGSASGKSAIQYWAQQFGWGSGAEWQALNNLEMHEAGYNPRIANSSSGALGLAQALGHGSANTGGTLGNEYGAQYGLSVAEARAANSGNAMAQAKWMMGYIKSRYGSPSAAWAQYCNHGDGKCWY